MSNLLKEYIQGILSEVRPKPATKIAAVVKKSEFLLANKQLGYAAEWALYDALMGVDDSLFRGGSFPRDNRLTNYWSNADKTSRTIFRALYAKMREAAKTSVGKTFSRSRPAGKPIHPPSSFGSDASGEDRVSTTEKVDVPTNKNNFHVKYNDDQRLLGFQKEKTVSTGEDGSQVAGLVADIYFRALEQHVLEMRDRFFNSKKSKDLKAEFDALPPNIKQTLLSRKAEDFDKFVTSGVIRRPKGQKAGSKMLRDFEEIKHLYQFFIGSDANRQAFLRKLEGTLNKGAVINNIRRALVQEIYSKLGSIQDKPTYFANFTGTPREIDAADVEQMGASLVKGYSVSLQLTNYIDILPSMDDIYVVPTGLTRDQMAAVTKDTAKRIGMLPGFVKASGAEETTEADEDAKQTTAFYNITDKTGKKVYFKIEFRIDGQGQPPQLKMGPELLAARRAQAVK